MNCPKAALFDVDDTLAESFQPPSADMIDRLMRLLDVTDVSIVTGAGLARLEKDFVDILEGSRRIDHLYLLPNSSAQAYTWSGGWNEEYNLALTADERARIKEVLAEASQTLELIRDTEYFGERIADREAQVAFTIVGLDAPQAYKMSWDPGAAKRRIIRDWLVKRLPEYDIRTGGASTIDVTRSGINKAYGVRWLAERLKCEPADMLYVGDSLFEGGNDAVVIPTGIQTHSVTNPGDTEKVIDELIASCFAARRK